MSTTVTPTTIQAILVAGSWPDNTLNTYNIFDTEQPKTRRRYPSCEIIYVPEGHLEDRKQTDKTMGFEIRYYDKIVGGRSQQIQVLKSVEDEIMALVDVSTTILEDPNILVQTFQWTREHVQRDETHPEYNVSILKIFIKSRLEAGQINDAIMNLSVPTGTNSNPSQIFDTEVYEGFRTTEEAVTKHEDGPGIPLRYRGNFQSTFITHIHVLKSDIGTTGDKANQLNTLDAFGEKQLITVTLTQNTDDSPTKHTISWPFIVEVDRVEYAFTWNDIVVFRVYGHLTKPSSTNMTAT